MFQAPFERADRGANARLRAGGKIVLHVSSGGNVYGREVGEKQTGERSFVVSADEAAPLSDGRLLIRSRDYLSIGEKE